VILHLLIPAALALEIPAFEPDRAVTLVPGDQPFPVKQVEEATAHTERDVYVLVYQEVNDGQRDARWSSETEEAVEEVWAAWSLEEGFDAREDLIILLANDEREVRVRAGSRWDVELGLHNEALGRLIDEHFMPAAVAGDLDGGLAGLALGVDEAISEGLAAAERRAQLRWAPLPLAGFAGLGFAGFVGLRRRREREEERQRFREATRYWRERLEAAEAEFAGFTLDVEMRDKLVALRARGERTEAFCAEIAALIEEVRAGLVGLKRRLEASERIGEQSGDWAAALAALKAPLEVDTGEHRLFEDPARTVKIEPDAFMKGLEDRYAEARDRWETLHEAVDASLDRAEDQLPTDTLEALRAALAEAGLGEAWLEGHPLLAAPEATYDALNALRRGDPVAWLERLDGLRAAEVELADDVRGMLSRLTELRAAREGDRAVAATSSEASELDPRSAFNAAEVAARAVDALTREDVEPEAFDRAIQRALEAERRFREVNGRGRDAIAVAPEALALGRRQLEALRCAIDSSRERLVAQVGDHSNKELETPLAELREASADLAEAEAALDRAEALLKGGQHQACVGALAELDRERLESLEDLGQMAAALELLEQTQQEAEALWARMDAIRADRLKKLRSIGATEEDLEFGDRALAELRQRWEGSRGGWAARLAGLQNVLYLWDREGRTHIASEGLKEEIARLKRSEQLNMLTLGTWDFFKDLAGHVTARGNSGNFREPIGVSPTTYHSSDSLSRSFSHRSSASSRSSRASGRSAGRSFSSSGRSGGRSVSSSGRSGGRKF
jgi:uncharacterized membrane protein YgcG